MSDKKNSTGGLKIKQVSFSPTGTTEAVLNNIADGMGMAEQSKMNMALPSVRDNLQKEFSGGETDIFLFGVPVYVGRMPKLAKKMIKNLDGNGRPAAAVAVYGNREYGIALKQLVKLLKSRNFNVIGAGAFIGEHSYSSIFPAAPGRPDDKDAGLAKKFGKNILEKIKGGIPEPVGKVGGKISLLELMTPAKGPRTSVDMSKCTDCGACVKYCTMGVLDSETKDYSNKKARDLCLGCMSCVKRCPGDARSFYMSDTMKKIVGNVLKDAINKRREPYVAL